MYAVIKTGSHQYRVQQGDVIRVEKLEGKAGDQVTFSDVMMIGGSDMKVGAPLVAGASVTGVIKDQARDEKIIVFKYKRRKGYKRTKGHRQLKTVVEISSIAGA